MLVTAPGARAQTPTCQFRGTPDALAERPSPLDSVQVTLGGQVAKLCYGRPSVSGTMIGGEFPFGTPWEMGANEPTTLHLPFSVRVGSVEVGPGSYSLYAIPGEQSWTVVVNGNPNRWGTPISADVRAADLGSFTVVPEPLGTPVERLSFSFRSTGERSGELVYAWERVGLTIPVVRP